MEEFKLEPKDIWNAVILISVGLILTMGYLIYSEYSSAKDTCEDFDGEFEYEFPSVYYCDDKPFFRYNDGWDYEKNFSKQIDFNKLKFP